MSGVSQWFWSLTTLACLVWYATITFFVAYRGAIDIRDMLRSLRQGDLGEEHDAPDSTH